MKVMYVTKKFSSARFNCVNFETYLDSSLRILMFLAIFGHFSTSDPVHDIVSKLMC